MEKAIKFSIENKQFVRALKTATKVINRKNALPILSSVGAQGVCPRVITVER